MELNPLKTETGCCTLCYREGKCFIGPFNSDANVYHTGDAALTHFLGGPAGLSFFSRSCRASSSAIRTFRTRRINFAWTFYSWLDCSVVLVVKPSRRIIVKPRGQRVSNCALWPVSELWSPLKRSWAALKKYERESNRKENISVHSL